MMRRCVVTLAAVAATANARPLPRIVGVEVTASSTAAPSSDRSFEAWRVLIAGSGQRWCEGKADEGIGETLVVRFAAPIRIDTVTIRAGVWESDESFQANNTVAAIDVFADNRRRHTIALPAERTPTTVGIGGDPITRLTLRLAKVGKQGVNDSCISGVELTTRPWTAFLVGVDNAHAASLAATLGEIATAFERCDAKRLERVVALPLAYRRHTRGDSPPTKIYRDRASLVDACKARELIAFREMSRASPDVISEAPGRVVVRYDLLVWHVAIDGRGWKLVGLEDDADD